MGSSPSGPRNPLSPTVEGFALAGVSDLPDPATHAYRKDLADTSLAGRVIASHYAEPLVRTLATATPLYEDGADDSAVAGELAAGEQFQMLDCSRGWAWGYAASGRVGYVPASVIAG